MKPRDEKFSLDSFFNTIKGISTGIKSDFFSKQLDKPGDKSYMTTQEEATSDAYALQQRQGKS